jgi:hypothetical protein
MGHIYRVTAQTETPHEIALRDESIQRIASAICLSISVSLGETGFLSNNRPTYKLQKKLRKRPSPTRV